jgi:protein-S-isoprenylcysteine O-methyltransferase Ste14
MIHLQTLSFPNVLFYLANALWLLEFVFFRNRKRQGDFIERASFWFLTITIGLVIYATIFFSRLGIGTFQPSPFYATGQWLALSFYGFGLYFRYQGSRALGRNFTRHVAVSKSMTLIEHGPYRYWRHPLYLGLGLIVIGFPLFVGNWLSLALIGPFLVVGFIWRMRVEEKALIKIHPEYLAWRKKRYWLIPFVF